jgi:hypothetical protein
MEAAMSATPKVSIYDGRQHVAVIEQRKDGWHVTVHGRRIGVCEDRETALRLVNVTINPPQKDL